jgi:hypothetical protein
MSKFDELKAEIAQLHTSFSAQLAAIDAKLSAVPSGTSDAEIDDVLTDLRSLQSDIDKSTATLSAPPADASPADSPPADAPPAA